MIVPPNPLRSRGLVQVGVVVTALALAATVLVALPLLPPPAAAHATGLGPTVVPTRHLPEGWFTVTWRASAGHRPSNGCLFGLLVSGRDGGATPKEWRRGVSPDQKLTYRMVVADSTYTGSTGPLSFREGDYELVIEGSCRWDVTITPTNLADATPAPQPPQMEQ